MSAFVIYATILINGIVSVIEYKGDTFAIFILLLFWLF